MQEKKENYVPLSGWTAFLDPEKEDPYSNFKDAVSLQVEQVILNVQNELLKKVPEYTKEQALKAAVCLVMERMLVLQNEHFPQSMNAMAASLFADLPGLSDLRYELLYPKDKKKEKTKMFGWLFRWFSRNK